MNTLEFLIILILSILMGLSVYRIADLTSKLNVIRKRYDNMARGKGDLSLEELVQTQSGDIDNLYKKIKQIELMQRNENRSLYTKNNISAQRLEDNINEIDTKLSSMHNTFNKQIEQRVYNLESEQLRNFEELNAKLDSNIENINKRIINNLNEAKSESNTNIRKLAEKQDFDINKIIQKNEEFKKELQEETKRSIKLMDEKLAFAIQKVALKRYNALETQSGNLSFSIVMLDQFNNGIIITSINTRDSSYTYSKTIKNGKSELDCSPEELEAIREALDER